MEPINAVSLTVAGGMMLYLAVQRYRARDKVDASVDQRAADLIMTVTKPLQDVITRLDNIVAEERGAKEKAENARDVAVNNLVTFMERSQDKQDAKDEKTAKAHKDALERVHSRVDDCEKHREKEKAEKEMIVHRVEALENRERDTLRNTPAPGQPTLVLQTPAHTTIAATTP